MRINLEIDKGQFNIAFYPLLFDYSHRWEIYNGSAGSGKSYFITEKLLIRACMEQIRILVCRRYGTTIRQTVFKLFKDILKHWQLLEYVKVNESDYRITLPNGSEILFTGLDEETKLLSLTDISTIWVEEAFEVSKDIIDQLNLRMRGKANNQQLILSFNPISKQHWLYDFCEIAPPENFIYHHSTYKDNKFLNEEYIKALEELYIKNPQKARVYCDGEWGVNADGLVLRNWCTEELNEMDLAKKYPHRVGSDLGFIDETTIISTYYDADNKTIYVADEFAKSGQTLDEIYDAISRMGLLKSTIYFDAAEPRTIDYFKRKGINAKPCIKGQNSVQARIAFLQNHKIVINHKCSHLIDDISNFSYEKNKQTGQFMDDKYTHEFSHTIDGLGYAYSDIYTKTKLRTIDKSILGL